MRPTILRSRPFSRLGNLFLLVVKNDDFVFPDFCAHFEKSRKRTSPVRCILKSITPPAPGKFRRAAPSRAQHARQSGAMRQEAAATPASSSLEARQGAASAGRKRRWIFRAWTSKLYPKRKAELSPRVNHGGAIRSSPGSRANQAPHGLRSKRSTRVASALRGATSGPREDSTRMQRGRPRRRRPLSMEPKRAKTSSWALCGRPSRPSLPHYN